MLTAVITGAGGQDGSLLSEYLLEKNYKVVGVVRRRSTALEFKNLEKSLSHKNFTLVYGDITDNTFIGRLLYDYHPQEYYALAADSHVGQSFIEPVKCFDVNATAVINQLESIRQNSPYTRFYNAATSELFGGEKCPTTGYTESSQFYPKSPYALAKLAAFHATRNYREAYGIFACSGILHNHSSTRRGYDFATRKITRGIAAIKAGKKSRLLMGNMDAFRDESHALDMIRGMHMMLQRTEPDDFLLASGSGATIRDMAKIVCEFADLNYDEIYKQDDRFMRPSDVELLLGNPSKANSELGWTAEIKLQDLLKEMYEYDLEDLKE